MEITNDSLLLTLWKVNVKGTLLAKVNMVIRIQPAVPLNYSQSDVIHLWICPYLGWRWWQDFHCRMSFRTMPCLIRGTELRAFVFDLQVVKHGNNNTCQPDAHLRKMQRHFVASMSLPLINGERWRTHVVALMRQFVQFCKKTMAVHFIAMCLQGYISMSATPYDEELSPVINQKMPGCQEVAVLQLTL